MCAGAALRRNMNRQRQLAERAPRATHTHTYARAAPARTHAHPVRTGTCPASRARQCATTPWWQTGHKARKRIDVQPWCFARLLRVLKVAPSTATSNQQPATATEGSTATPVQWPQVVAAAAHNGTKPVPVPVRCAGRETHNGAKAFSEAGERMPRPPAQKRKPSRGNHLNVPFLAALTSVGVALAGAGVSRWG